MSSFMFPLPLPWIIPSKPVGWTSADKVSCLPRLQPFPSLPSEWADKAQLWPWHHCLNVFRGPGTSSLGVQIPEHCPTPECLSSLISPGHHGSAASDQQPYSLTAWEAPLLLCPVDCVQVQAQLLASSCVKPSTSIALPPPQHPCTPVTTQSRGLWLFAHVFLPTPQEWIPRFLPWDTSPPPATPAPSTAPGHSIFLVNVGRMRR